ncbi:hypothetical protein BDC45DRAFT_567471 [Circinella umbellata]|nr:hypothetical protein BDC45DRAFT_567471 [Circinella umbellata]
MQRHRHRHRVKDFFTHIYTGNYILYQNSTVSSVLSIPSLSSTRTNTGFISTIVLHNISLVDFTTKRYRQYHLIKFEQLPRAEGQDIKVSKLKKFYKQLHSELNNYCQTTEDLTIKKYLGRVKKDNQLNNRQLSECCNKAQGNYSSFSTGETTTINVNVTNIFSQLTDSTPKDSADTATSMEDIQTKIQFKRKKTFQQPTSNNTKI